MLKSIEKLILGKKKFDLINWKEINMFFEHKMNDILVNDDNNNIACSLKRNIIVVVKCN